MIVITHRDPPTFPLIPKSTRSPKKTVVVCNDCFTLLDTDTDSDS